MGLVRNSTMKDGDYLEGMLSDYVGGKAKPKVPRSSSARLVTVLTCLQFAFAVYATFLLYYMSPTIDLRTKPEFTWATRIAQQWKQLIIPPHVLGRYQEAASLVRAEIRPTNPSEVCEHEKIDFQQKKSNDAQMIKLKRELYDEVLDFQSKSIGTETLSELMAMKSKWDLRGPGKPKVTVILNHFKRKTLCAQLDSLLHQTLPFHHVWVLSFGSPNELSLKRIVDSYNDSRISFISSSYDFKYYGRFQMALQTEADLVYIVDDDMIPGRKMLQILSHVAGTEKYKNSVLGSIGRILPFRQKDFTFPSYRKFRSKEAGLYLPDPAYDITIEKIVQVDFLSSSWFLSAELVKTLFIEAPLTFMTGEDLHLSYQLQKYRNAGSFVLPVDPNDKETWGDSEHRLAYVSETTVIFKDIVQVRDDQWWRALSTGYVTQWAAMHPQKIDALFYAHSVDEVKALSPLIEKFRSTAGKKAVVSEAVSALWPKMVCKERRFKIFDLAVTAQTEISNSEVPVVQAVYSSVKGLIKTHNPTALITVSDIDPNVKKALKMATETNNNGTTMVLLPRPSISKVLWMADLRSTALPNWNKMRVSVNIITQNRAPSLTRLLKSLSDAYYVGDEIPISFNVDSKVDEETIRLVSSFNWPHGPKTLRRRIIQGGLIRAVSESWYPSSDDDYGLLLEDDIEVSPFYYLWIKYALLAYHYDPQVSLPELSSISLYTPRLVEVVKERPKWNATDFFKRVHPNTPYLHQLPCSWGSVFFPKQWRAMLHEHEIPKSRTNGWQASWKKFLIDMMYLRGYVSLYPNFPNQASFSTNHMEPGAHISAKDNVVKHDKTDFEVPLLKEDFRSFLPNGKFPPASKLPSLNLFNQPVSLKGLKAAGAKLGQDVLRCDQATEIVSVDHETDLTVQRRAEMGTIHRSGVHRYASLCTILGVAFGFLLIHIPSSFTSSLKLSIVNQNEFRRSKSLETLGSGSNVTNIYVPTNPRGAELLPPGIVVAESDFNLRRLWDIKKKPKYLLTFTVGYDQRKNINTAVKKFSDDFQILLFHYDGRTSEWDQFEWSKSAIHVSVMRQTKWWYAKRFLHPDIVGAYEYIFIWDEDLGVEHFNGEKYIELVKKHGLEISQPGLEPDNGLTWQMTKRRGDREVHKDTEEKPGWCSNPHLPPCAAFVEIMAPVFSREAWRCVWHMIQMIWCMDGIDFALRRCVEPAHEKIGVVDSQWIIHQVIPSLGSQISYVLYRSENSFGYSVVKTSCMNAVLSNHPGIFCKMSREVREGKSSMGRDLLVHPLQVRARCRNEWSLFRSRLADAEQAYLSQTKKG
uniref:Glycosyl transferase 64 domain-containing protein n=1 Tax=Salix viminalis TaxID=40686 RepID=A0A6N2L1X5_SALVM